MHFGRRVQYFKFKIYMLGRFYLFIFYNKCPCVVLCFKHAFFKGFLPWHFFFKVYSVEMCSILEMWFFDNEERNVQCTAMFSAGLAYEMHFV